MKKFSRKTKEKLQDYVYALVDPNNNEIFYVGRGSTNTRPFDHLKFNGIDKDKEKIRRIKTIQAQGNEPQIDIIRYGLNRKEAREVEAAVIDSLGMKNLTNLIRGQGTERGRSPAESIEQQLGGRPIEIENIKVRAILFYCHSASIKYDLYDSTRQFWDVNGKKVQEKIDGEYKYPYAFAMKGSTILEVYKILNWYPAGSTVSTREFEESKITKWEFIGSLADDSVRRDYRNKVMHKNGAPLPATQKGFRYLE